MPAHSLELLLDQASDARVREQWARLAEAGLPSLAGHPGPTNAPHVTLAAFGSAPGEELEARLPDALAGLPLRVRLGAPMVFGHRRMVLVRSLVPTAGLLALHTAAYAVAASAPSVLPHFAPGDWTPHVTLARGIRSEQVGEAIAALGPDGDDLVTLVAARRWDPDAECVWTL